MIATACRCSRRCIAACVGFVLLVVALSPRLTADSNSSTVEVGFGETDITPKLGELTLSKFDKFLLQAPFNTLAGADYSEWVVKRAKTLLSSIFIEAVDLGF